MRRPLKAIAPLALAGLLTFAAKAAAPAIASSPASGVTAKSATFNGALTAGGSAEVSVHWGTSQDDLWMSAPLGTLAEGPVAFTEYGLLSGRTYYVRFRAANAEGEAWSDVQAFDTTPLAANPRYGGGSYDGYASAQAVVAVRPSASLILVR